MSLVAWRSAAGAAALAFVLAACNGSTTTTTTPGATQTAVPGVPISTAYVNGWFTPLRAPGTPSTLPVLTVTSTDFTNGGAMPASSPQTGCTAAGAPASNVSPQLSWTAGPAGTLSYMVELYDPIAPTGTGFWHWTVYNIPASTTSFPTGYGTTVPSGGVIFGYTDYGASGYGGPCPPVGDGTHLYFFIVSALNTATISGASAASTGTYANFATRGTILAQGMIYGTYSR